MKRPAIDTTTVCAVNVDDIYGSVLSADYRAGVAAALPRGVVASDDFWLELSAVVAGYVISRRNRESRPAAAREIERFERIIGMATTPGEQPAELALIKTLAESQLAAHQVVSAGFQRKQNMHIEGFCFGILSLWTRELGQKPGVSRPGGPLVRFFNACATPLLGKPYSASGVASIVIRQNATRNVFKR